MERTLRLPIDERQNLIFAVATSLGEHAPSVGIERTPGVVGGSACLVRTRIPVWTIENFRRAGATDAEILADFPTLRPPDLVSAKIYARLHRDEIEREIRENEEAQLPVANLYSNENFPFPVVERLRALGHNVLTVQGAGNADQSVPDDEVVRYAREHGRAVLTLNRRDFIKLHNVSDDHCGIVVCTVDLDSNGLAGRIHDGLAAVADLNRQLVKVYRPG